MKPVLQKIKNEIYIANCENEDVVVRTRLKLLVSCGIVRVKRSDHLNSPAPGLLHKQPTVHEEAAFPHGATALQWNVVDQLHPNPLA